MAGSQDIFDSIVMADERFHGEGYREGYEEGSSLGVMEGRQHGTLHGAKIGSEDPLFARVGRREAERNQGDFHPGGTQPEQEGAQGRCLWSQHTDHPGPTFRPGRSALQGRKGRQQVLHKGQRFDLQLTSSNHQ
ncbi:protein LTO1 homolog isoform X5 [Macaca fascicularis]|uniref:protein LTO1 homolog isoform X5 n=1 Tax=Macaca fascicularis TaxID=9541 RepID=UPI003D15AE20